HRAARAAAQAPAQRDAGPLPRRRGVLLGAGGAGQPGRVATVRAGAAGTVAGQADRAQTHLAPGDVGAVVGIVEGARRRAAGDPRHGVPLSRASPFTASVRSKRAMSRVGEDNEDVLLVSLTGSSPNETEEDVVTEGNRLSRGDKRRNAKLA